MSELPRKIVRKTAFSISAFSLVTALMMPSAAHAQDSLVGACTGVSLPPSVVTEILGPVVNGVVTPTEDRVNALIAALGGLPGAGPALAPLNIDAGALLAAAAAGEPVTLQALATDGTVVGPEDDCNLTADTLRLDDQGGISIGGNRITGLGQNGETATAGGLDSVALGNNATTSAGADGAVALGTGSSATAANSVALGNGSVADRGPQTGVAAPGTAGTFDTAGSVSVGSVGAERQITNVAAGTQASDATNLRQVQGLVEEATALSIQYDSAAQGRVTLGGAGGTTIGNVADGTARSDAVNLGQLQDGMSTTLAQSRAYTDQRLEELGFGMESLAVSLEEVREEAFAGTAAALAVSGIPQTITRGRNMFGGSIGHYRGETAFAVGFSSASESGVVKIGGTLDTNGYAGVSAGAGISF
ncbi:YadA-like family protein [uncultured Algimonas sp.]|uniref:YadA-like family protein n=1 Tax=uncultured Algimonas sp. TaxID=1547920 RepID=UPI00260ECF2D|nr:YadA-like family protein [uncultured Algimonas sp.]